MSVASCAATDTEKDSKSNATCFITINPYPVEYLEVGDDEYGMECNAVSVTASIKGKDFGPKSKETSGTWRVTLSYALPDREYPISRIIIGGYKVVPNVNKVVPKGITFRLSVFLNNALIHTEDHTSIASASVASA